MGKEELLEKRERIINDMKMAQRDFLDSLTIANLNDTDDSYAQPTGANIRRDNRVRLVGHSLDDMKTAGIRNFLVRYGLSEDDITVDVDTDDSYAQPTGADILSGDDLFRYDRGFLGFCSGGHGYGMNLITVDNIGQFMDVVPEGCVVKIASDSCHIGGLNDEAKAKISESTRREDEGSGLGFDFKQFPMRTVHDALVSRGIGISLGDCHHDEGEGEAGNGDGGNSKNRSPSVSTLIEILKQKTGEMQKFVKVPMDKLHGGGDGSSGGGLMIIVGNPRQDFLKQKTEVRSKQKSTQGPVRGKVVAEPTRLLWISAGVVVLVTFTRFSVMGSISSCLGPIVGLETRSLSCDEGLRSSQASAAATIPPILLVSATFLKRSAWILRALKK